ncbi:MAG: HAD family hydrolase [Anaerolineae bacterium]|nr:HAD family hydrolase [Anaerolineae bacterium]
MKALIFDFDGLILDTELPDFSSWEEIYREHGCELPLEKWASILGGTGESSFDPYEYLEACYGKPLDRETIWIKRRKNYVEKLEDEEVLPGVAEYIASARDRGIKLAVASSSPENWVVGHLTHLGLIGCFDCICTADDVEKTKPDPALFLASAHDLGVKPEEVIVLEDSPNGVTAANRAGMFVVAVPNAITSRLNLEHADLILNSLEDMTLDELLERAGK